MTRYAHRPLTATLPRTFTASVAVPSTDTYSDGIDWIAVERVADGTYDGALLTPDEKRAAALAMVRAGYHDRDISTRLCVYSRQVARWKVDAGLTTPRRRCDIDGCDKPHATKGLCQAHHAKARRAAARQDDMGVAA